MEFDSSWSELLFYGALFTISIALVEALLWWFLRFWSHRYYGICCGVGGVVLLGGAYFSSVLNEPLSIAIVALVMFFCCWFFAAIWRGRMATGIMMMAPAFIIIGLLIVYPFFFQIRLSFANLNMYSIAKWLRTGELNFAGLSNYVAVFTSSQHQAGTWQALVYAPFWVLLFRTLVWTAINVIFHVGFGLALAMILNRDIWGKSFYRTLLIVPWAMPQVVAVLAWRGEFHPEFGYINQLIESLGMNGVSWWSDPTAIFISCCIVNIWLGIPFMMIVFLGGLGSIPKSYYEAASIDGANAWSQFWQITLPMLKPVVVPSVTLGTIWTFNNVNVIYLMTGQDGGTESSDILVSALYKSAFTYSRYSYAAAFAVVVFLVLLVMTAGWFKVSKVREV